MAGVKKTYEVTLTVKLDVDLDQWREDYGLELTADAEADAASWLPMALTDRLIALNGREYAYKVTGVDEGAQSPPVRHTARRV